MRGLRYFSKGEGDFRFIYFLPGEGCGVSFIKNGYFTMKILFNFHLGAGGEEHLTPQQDQRKNQ